MSVTAKDWRTHSTGLSKRLGKIVEAGSPSRPLNEEDLAAIDLAVGLLDDVLDSAVADEWKSIEEYWPALT